MGSRKELIQKALDLQVEFLRELGRNEEADEVARRVPIEDDEQPRKHDAGTVHLELDAKRQLWFARCSYCGWLSAGRATRAYAAQEFVDNHFNTIGGFPHDRRER